MQPTDDHALLRQFAENRSDDAFAALVERHLRLVHAVALRSAGQPQDAEEITQAVFILLAQKTPRLRHANALASWLFQATRLTANNFLRSETRRRRREQEAVMQSALDHEPSKSDAETWAKIAPVLDDAIARLREKDRQAILLRFYEGQSLRDVGLALGGASEFAVDRRIHRALEKLRLHLTRHGVASTTASLSATLAAHSAPAVPAGLAKTISAAALTKSAAVSTSTLTLVKGTLSIMAWTKAKTAIVISAAALFAAGTSTVVIKEIQARRTYPWQVPLANFEALYTADAQVKIVPTKFDKSEEDYCADSGVGAIGGAVSPKTIIEAAYSQVNDSRMAFEAALPTNRYDFIAKLVKSQPKGSRPKGLIYSKLENPDWTNALQKAAASKFGIRVVSETRDQDVIVMRPAKNGIKNVNPSTNQRGGATYRLEAIRKVRFELAIRFK